MYICLKRVSVEEDKLLQMYEIRVFRKVLEPEKDKGSEQLGYLTGNSWGTR
jgi:hypothetical protein